MNRRRMLLAVLIDELVVEPPDDLLGAADLRAVCSRAVVEVDGVHSREAYETAVAALCARLVAAYRDASYATDRGRYYVDGLCAAVARLRVRPATIADIVEGEGDRPLRQG